MILYCTEVDTGTMLPFCLLPSSIKAKSSGKFVSYDFINLGEVKIPSGLKLCSYSWSGVFPGIKMIAMPFIKQSLFRTPKAMVECIEKWRKNQTEVILTLTETPINANVYVNTFTYEPTGGVGNYNYSIEFIEAKHVTVNTSNDAATTSSAQSSNTSSGTRASTATTDTVTSSEQTSAYTVKSGDSLWNIAKSTLGDGSRYTEIYELNKSVIGSDPNMIYSGQTLTLPSN